MPALFFGGLGERLADGASSAYDLRNAGRIWGFGRDLDANKAPDKGLRAVVCDLRDSVRAKVFTAEVVGLKAEGGVIRVSALRKSLRPDEGVLIKIRHTKIFLFGAPELPLRHSMRTVAYPTFPGNPSIPFRAGS